MAKTDKEKLAIKVEKNVYVYDKKKNNNKKTSHSLMTIAWELIPLFGTLSRRGLNPIKPASIPPMSAEWLAQLIARTPIDGKFLLAGQYVTYSIKTPNFKFLASPVPQMGRASQNSKTALWNPAKPPLGVICHPQASTLCTPSTYKISSL